MGKGRFIWVIEYDISGIKGITIQPGVDMNQTQAIAYIITDAIAAILKPKTITYAICKDTNRYECIINLYMKTSKLTLLKLLSTDERRISCLMFNIKDTYPPPNIFIDSLKERALNNSYKMMISKIKYI